jgi:hypothetical protein
MNKLKMLLLTAITAATVGTGALASVPSASAAAVDPPPPAGDRPCRLVTSLGILMYDHMSTITVIGSDHKNHTYLCFDGHWYETKTATTTATYTGSLSGVLTRV